MATQKILIVDDSKTIRMQLKDMLPKGNFEVLEAKDGVEGFELISQNRPNLVLIDFFMPRMNGWEVVQKIQAFPKLQSIPIVMMSGRREDVEKAVPELFEYFEFVGKPFEQRLLFKAIKAATTKAKERYQELQQAKTTVKAHTNGFATPSGIPSYGNDEIQELRAELQQIKQENSQLKSELLTLKNQVVKILRALQQRQKS